ncbi:hypothetical protein CASFOL_017506 [Castilleja foliolosa]|uniref:Prohibitin n=1 Tax=Castilleja foliolosa TaxID=1961234 RepID=A0ABD3DCN1_9LAMI
MVYPEGTHIMIPWFERPTIYDVRARPHVVESSSGSRDLQMKRKHLLLQIALIVVLSICHNHRRSSPLEATPELVPKDNQRKKIQDCNGESANFIIPARVWLGRNRIRAIDLCELKCIKKLSLQSNQLTSMAGHESWDHGGSSLIELRGTERTDVYRELEALYIMESAGVASLA